MVIMLILLSRGIAMIKTKSDLKEYMNEDMKPIRTRIRPRLFGDECFKYVNTLRRLEYRMNKPDKSIADNVLYMYYKLCHHRQSVHWGLLLPPNVFGAGLTIFHTGTVIVNDSATVGKNCHLYNCVNIAENCKIGNNVYIAPGVKILPNVEIADNIRIGANAVVTKSFTTPGITIAGAPAVQISGNDGTH